MNLLNLWPFAVLVIVFVALLVQSKRGRYRAPLPVKRHPADAVSEVNALAEMVRSGAFYVTGTVLDWNLCREFATKVVTKTDKPGVKHVESEGVTP
jgi:hypothetical protein